MKRIIVFFSVIFLYLVVSAAPKVFVLEIDEEIDAAAWRHTRHAIEEATADGAKVDLFLIKLNTYGGAVDMADSIRTAVMRMQIPTVAFVDHNAASAGALIALSCDSVFMAPGASMGAATVVDGQGSPMPPKYQSYWSSIMRSTAMSHGKYKIPGDSVEAWRRDPQIAASMVDPENAISLTPVEAVQCGYADGIASSIKEVLSELNYEDADIIWYEPSLTDAILGFLASAAVRAVLVMLILGGLYLEMRTSGMGMAGAVASVAVVLYFLPMIVTGTLAPWVIILFIIGIILLALEIFVIPGFGVTGVLGIFAVAASLIGAMLHTDSIGGVDWSGLSSAITPVLAGIAMAVVLLIFLTSKYGPKWIRNASSLTTELKDKDGFVGVDMSPASLVGRHAYAATDLRPAGKVEIDGSRLDATSMGEFISAGTPVVVVKYEAAQIYVEKI